MVNYFLENFLFSHLLELFAALAGTFYLARRPHVEWVEKFFVYFLWANLFIDLFGFYTVYAYFTNYETLPIKGTPFERNYWWYNSYKVLTFLIYFTYFIKHLGSAKSRKVFKFLAGFFAITSIANLITSDVFFIAYSAYTTILGTFILMLCISAYYFEMLSTNKVLNFYKNLSFYISVGALFWYLMVTPLFIYSRYFTMQSPEFVELHAVVLKLANFFMYTCFGIGFIICSQKKNSYSSATLSR